MFHIAESKGGARWDAADPMPPVLGDDPVMVEAMGKSSRKTRSAKQSTQTTVAFFPPRSPLVKHVGAPDQEGFLIACGGLWHPPPSPINPHTLPSRISCSPDPVSALPGG